jgi:hypothetical protein
MQSIRSVPARWLGFFIVCWLSAAGPTLAQNLNHLFKSGDDGYKCYRIPAIVTTKKGTLLAFAEARRNNCGDAGDIDLVVKRSSDGGKTWSAMSLVWSDAHNTCGDVVSHNTARVKGVKASGPPFWGYPLHMAGKTVGIGHPHPRAEDPGEVEGAEAEAVQACQ